jgi:tRNA(Ile)-lysidine synthetase-like protein
LRVMNILGAEAEFVAATAQRWQARKSRRQLSLLPLAVQRQVVQGQLIQLGVEPAFDLVEHLRSKPGQAVMVSPNVVLLGDRQGRISRRPAPRARGEDQPAKAGRRRRDTASMVNRIALRLAAGEVKLNGLHVQWRRTRHRRSRMPRWRPGCEFFDADRVGAAVRLRSWRAGDRFQPSGFASPAKLQDLFTNLKVPRAQRHRRVIGETAAGEIFWVEGLRIAERFKLDKQTVRCLKWTWKRE